MRKPSAIQRGVGVVSAWVGTGGGVGALAAWLMADKHAPFASRVGPTPGSAL
jgi:hypothetical protein